MPWPGYFRIDYDQRLLPRQAGAEEALAEHGHRRAVRHIGHKALELMTIKKKPFVDQEAASLVDVL